MSKVLSFDDVLDLPVVVDIVTAGRAFGIGVRGSYTLAQAGDFPVPVLRIGRKYRVRTSDILRKLGISVPSRMEVAMQLTEPPKRASPAA